MDIDEQFKDIQNDIEEMNKMYEQEGVDEDVEEPKETEEPEEPETPEEPEEPEEPTEPPATEAPSTEAPSTEAPTTEAPEEELSVESLMEENRKLREKLVEKLGTTGTEQPTEEPKKPIDVPIAPVDFLGDEGIDEVIRDKESFNKILNQVYSKGINDARNSLSEGVLRTIPDIVKTNVKIMNDLREASDKFYDMNKDLVPFKRVVSAVFEEIAADNPDKNYTELLDDVAKETRDRLELHRQAISNTRDKDKPPTLPHKRSQRRVETKPNVSRLEAEIAEMDKALT